MMKLHLCSDLVKNIYCDTILIKIYAFFELECRVEKYLRVIIWKSVVENIYVHLYGIHTDFSLIAARKQEG